MTDDDYSVALPRKRMAACMIFHDEQQRVLLVEPTYKDYWEVPGGTVEAGESPKDAAAREIKEELGLVVAVGRLLAIDYVPVRDGRTEGMIFVYDGGALAAEQQAGIQIPACELRSWAWSTSVEAEKRLSPLLARRVAACLKASRDGRVAELENGYLR